MCLRHLRQVYGIRMVLHTLDLPVTPSRSIDFAQHVAGRRSDQTALVREALRAFGRFEGVETEEVLLDDNSSLRRLWSILPPTQPSDEFVREAIHSLNALSLGLCNVNHRPPPKPSPAEEPAGPGDFRELDELRRYADGKLGAPW